MQFKLLGQLEMRVGGNSFCPSAPKVCQVLALLLLQPNRIVGVDTVIDEVWEENPPRSAVTTAQTYIYHLRKALANETSPDGSEPMLTTRAPGYLLNVDPELIDVTHFHRLIDQGRALLREGRPDQGAQKLRSALELWTGSVLSNLTPGPVLRGRIAELKELHIAALEARIEADMMLGRHRELIPELRVVAKSFPLNEWFHSQLIEALRRCGRRGEALQAYEHLRAMLVEDLGLDPSPELQRLQHKVLA